MQPRVPSNPVLGVLPRPRAVYNSSCEFFGDWQHVHHEVVDARDVASCNAASQRAFTVGINFKSLGVEECQLLLSKLPNELQLRSQIMSLPRERFLSFLYEAPFRQQHMEPASERENGTTAVPEAFVGMPASPTAAAVKMEPIDDPVLRSSTVKTEPTNEWESRQAVDGNTKRKREGYESSETATSMRPRTSDTRNATAVRRSSSEIRDARNARRGDRPWPKTPSQARTPEHKHISRQFRYPLNHHDVHGGHIGDDWEEFPLKGEKRLVGWQWFNGYARRVIKSPSTMFGMRSLLRPEELAVVKAGLRLVHEEGMGEVKVKVEDA